MIRSSSGGWVRHGGKGSLGKDPITEVIELLFPTGSEIGAAWDFTDTGLLFQESTGVTPVSAASNPLGLVLDRRRKGQLGSEQINNANWTTGVGATITGSTITYSGSLVTGAVVTQVPPLATGNRAWQVRYTIESITGLASLTVGGVNATARSAPGTYSEVVFGTGSTNVVVTGRGTGVSAIVIKDISVREIPGSHLIQATAGARPTWNASQRAAFNGTSSWMQTASALDLSGSDKVFVIAGVRKLSDASFGILYEHGTNTGSVSGSFYVAAPAGASPSWSFASRGTATVATTANNAIYAAPQSAVVCGVGDISAPSVALRHNGTQVASSGSSQGTGNYASLTGFVGARNGAASFANMELAFLAIRGGPLPDAATIARIEQLVNGANIRAF